jgi:site-specific DNA-adenine methylase
MFSYYGSKSKVIKKYPPPVHGLIIEPFAGSARYALEYWDRDVILVDKFHKIVEAWRYLQQATPEQVLALPDIDPGDDLRNYPDMPDGARWLIGFGINAGTSNTRYKVTGDGKFNRWKSGKRRIAGDLFKIRHWRIIHGDYRCIGPVVATHFIDPPYFTKAGLEYKHNSRDLDMVELGKWCRSLPGQVIVCENDSSPRWLPFEPLARMYGSNFHSTEVIWTNSSGAPDKGGL